MTACPGCGIVLPDIDGPVHAHYGVSPACWAYYAQLGATPGLTLGRLRQLMVDAYAVQHPGEPGDPRAIRSVAIHLMTLCMYLENGTDPVHGRKLHQRMVAQNVFYHELVPPARRGDMTAFHVFERLAEDNHEKLLYDWARSAYVAWSEHHATVRAWVVKALG